MSTTGSTDADCIGLVTITTNQNELNQEEDARRKAANAKRRTSIIAGVVVTVVVLLLIAGGVWWWLRRGRKSQEIEEGGIDTLPRQFIETGSSGQILSINNFLPSGASITSSPNKSSFSPGAQSLAYASEPFNPYNDSSIADSSHLSSGSGPGANLRNRPSFANFPHSSVRRSKAAEAAHESTSEIGNADPTQRSSVIASGSAGGNIWPVRSGSLQENGVLGTPVDNELIYQHQDAGQVVRELPPPYLAPPDVTPQENQERRS